MIRRRVIGGAFILVMMLGVFAAPTAVAQDVGSDWLTLQAAPFPRDVPPLSSAVMTNVTASINCAIVYQSTTPTSVEFTLADAPEWGQFTFTPPTAFADDSACPTGVATATSMLVAAVTADAPAFAKTKIMTRASITAPSDSYTATAPLDITVAWLSLIDAVAPTTIAMSSPGEWVVFPVTVTNVGNGPTRIIFTLAPSEDAWEARMPADLTLAPSESATVDVSVKAGGTGVRVNEVAITGVVIKSHYEGNPSLEGDTTRVNFLVTSKGWDAPSPAPGSVGAIIALALASAWRARSRRA